MTARFMAIVEHGKLCPTVPLELPDGTSVEVTIVAPALHQNPHESPGEILARIAAIPSEPVDPVTSARHDDVLYSREAQPVIFVDTGAWFASMVPSDANHPAAVAWVKQNKDSLITSDYVFSETVTLLLARNQRAQAEAFGLAILGGRLATLHVIGLDEINAAWQVFQHYRDKEWSFADCTSKVLIEQLGITTAFSFDHHFRQFGTVAVVP